MKFLYGLFAVFVSFVFACTTSADYKAIRKDVVDVHDEAMQKTSLIMRNKMRLDTLMFNLDSLKKAEPGLDTAILRSDMITLISHLTSADEQMTDWMHDFDPDVSGKSNQEAVKYFEGQLVEIKDIDSLCEAAIQESDNYLRRVTKQ